jgi:hypothetical protein
MIQPDYKLTDYKATREELFALAQHWYFERHWIDFEAWRDQSGINSTDWHRQMYTNERLDAIAKILGDAEMKEALAMAKKEFVWRIGGEEVLRIWTDGTEEEQEAFRRKVWKQTAVAEIELVNQERIATRTEDERGELE